MHKCNTDDHNELGTFCGTHYNGSDLISGFVTIVADGGLCPERRVRSLHCYTYV